MVCTAARGGMRSVIEGYLADGVFSRWNVVLLNSHVEGGFVLRLLTAVAEFLRMLSLLARGRVSLVHCHAAMKGSFWRKSLFALTARMAGVPVIFHIHGGVMKAFVARQPRIIRRLIAWILEKQSLVIVLSESWRRYVESIAPKARVDTLSNYVDLPDLSDKSDNKDAIVEVLFLGVINAPKGVYDLLPAFRAAVAKAPELRLVLAGKGELEQANSMVRELQLEEHVTFAGWVSGDGKLDLLRRAQICVLPSHNEGLPVCLLEAMAWQIPVISTRVGGIPDLVREGCEGLLVDAGDQDGLSRALVQLAINKEIRDAMGSAGRKCIEQNFSRNVVLPKLEGMYRSLIFSGDMIRKGEA
jgi:glycosyltransferase involved in cell wall biosynthesis